MSRMNKPRRSKLFNQKIVREIAPGVCLHVKRAKRLAAPASLNRACARMQDAWAVLRGKAQAMEVPGMLKHAKRRAA